MKNLFVVSHFGQMIQCNKFVAIKGFRENELAILYTPKNLEMPKLTEETANKDYFNHIEWFELPIGCMKQRADLALRMQANYKKLLHKHQPTDLYLFSFEGHYVLLAHLAKKMKIRVHLIEEGTATYKFTAPIERHYTSLRWRPALDQAYSKSKASKNPWIRSLVYLLFLPRDIVDFVKWFYVQDKFQGTLLKFLPRGLSGITGRFTKFDSIHVAFPEVLQPHFPQAQIQEYFVYEQAETDLENSESDVLQNILIKQVIEKYTITESDVVFVSQRYPITLNVLTAHIIQKLEKLIETLPEDNNRILLKLHPKETEAVKTAYKKAAKHLGKKAVLIDSPPFPVEALLSQVKVKALVGISSTSLAYAAKVDKNLEIYCIGESLAKDLKKLPLEKAGAEQIESHVSLLKFFPHIKHI